MKEDIWCDDAFIILKDKLKNTIGDRYIVNHYGPHDPLAKFVLWNRIHDFRRCNRGKYIMFDDMNEVRNAQERHGSSFSRSEVEVFNNFVNSSNLIDIPLGDIGTPLLEAMKSQKQDAIKAIKIFNDKIKDGFASNEDRVSRIKILHEIDKLDSFEVIDNIQKAHIKLDVEDDDNSKFFHCLINQKRRSNFIKGIKHVGVWVTDPHQMPLGSNSSFITPIPKVANPVNINDFWPISLIGVHYKIIAKVIDNRLSKVVDKIVSHEQSDFIMSRQILDGPLILSEAIDWYKKRKKKMSWIKAFLESSRTLILINGIPTSEFNVRRGLRQGDLLCPFLFTIIMEGLNVALLEYVRNGLILSINIDGVSILLLISYGSKLLKLCMVVKVVLILMVANSIVFGLRFLGLLTIYIRALFFPWIPFSFRWVVALLFDFRRIFGLNWSCSTFGIRNSTHLNNILVEISHIEVRDDVDKCTWSLTHDGMFNVGDLRRLINDRTLPSLDIETTWDESLPRKVNIFIWRLKLDRLPHRLNLSYRAMTARGESNTVARRVVDDLVKFSGEATVLKIYIGQLNALIAKREAMEDQGEVYDSSIWHRDDRRDENNKLMGLNELIAETKEHIALKEAHLETMDGASTSA
uniref:RNA-directed DNA polymerase, eukaryota n=1 Tax=Tanacetum cinerariifolium TaxID=118510 RepID=A0A6L2LTM1_TANCI|nr:RNA-directed DNA polymerase, eukaryota [Tanacetum cinerariifolium]